MAATVGFAASGLRYATFLPPGVPTSDAFPSPGLNWTSQVALVYSATEAVLIDTAVTLNQHRAVIDWISRIIPGRSLTHTYTTHGHGDHWFGISALQRAYPGLKPLATKGTVAHMNDQRKGANLDLWNSWFPNGQIEAYPEVAQSLGEKNQFFLKSGVSRSDDKYCLADSVSEYEHLNECVCGHKPPNYLFKAIETGESDTYNTTVLWVPELRLVIGGDVVYGQAHQFLAESTTPALRAQWLRALDEVDALKPLRVVPGHIRPGEGDDVGHIAETKKYIRDFDAVMAARPRSADEIYDKMVELYPNRTNLGILRLSAKASFAALNHTKN